jgi:hypothetical protein
MAGLSRCKVFRFLINRQFITLFQRGARMLCQIKAGLVKLTRKGLQLFLGERGQELY